jgi:hypothetical protein
MKERLKIGYDTIFLHGRKHFPEYPWWFRHICKGQKNTSISLCARKPGRFVDAVVGKTAIEYEKNLTIQGFLPRISSS